MICSINKAMEAEFIYIPTGTNVSLQNLDVT